MKVKYSIHHKKQTKKACHPLLSQQKKMALVWATNLTDRIRTENRVRVRISNIQCVPIELGSYIRNQRRGSIQDWMEAYPNGACRRLLCGTRDITSLKVF